MNEKKVKAVSSSCMLDYDAVVFESLNVIKDMMDEVVHSELCKSGEEADTFFCPMIPKESLREDRSESLYTREEMLSGVSSRQGAFVVVPRVVGE